MAEAHGTPEPAEGPDPVKESSVTVHDAGDLSVDAMTLLAVSFPTDLKV